MRTDIQPVKKEDLLEHQIYFFSKHRGRRESLKDVEMIHSAMPEFNVAFALAGEVTGTINSEFRIYLPDWITETGETVPGRSNIGSVMYMSSAGTEIKPEKNKNIAVKRCVTLQDIEDFSLIQGRGFCETEDEFNEWYPWLREQNIKNFPETDQSFYVAYFEGIPAGVALTLRYRDIIGIYAVATLSEYRKHGISSAIMYEMSEDASNGGVETMTLQVAASSYAHSFYKKLGFEDIFKCDILAADN